MEEVPLGNRLPEATVRRSFLRAAGEHDARDGTVLDENNGGLRRRGGISAPACVVADSARAHVKEPSPPRETWAEQRNGIGGTREKDGSGRRTRDRAPCQKCPLAAMNVARRSSLEKFAT